MKTRTELLYEEALRLLHLYTGLINWDATIKAHVDNGYKVARCTKCDHGRIYTHDKWAYHDEGVPCRDCNGGIALVPL